MRGTGLDGPRLFPLVSVGPSRVVSPDESEKQSGEEDGGFHVEAPNHLPKLTLSRANLTTLRMLTRFATHKGRVRRYVGNDHATLYYTVAGVGHCAKNPTTEPQIERQKRKQNKKTLA